MGIGEIIGLIIIGLIIGALGRLFHPGPDPIGILLTIVIGIGSALLVGWLVGGGILGFILAVIVAVVLVALFSRAAGPLEKLLKCTPSTVTLRIELLPEAEIFHLNGLLRRLAPYGDRIFVHVDAQLRGLVRVDSSVFHLILE